MNRISILKLEFERVGFFYASHFIFLLLVSISLSAQQQINRYERLHKPSDHEFIIQSMEQQGLMLIRDTDKVEKGKKKWEIAMLDTAMHEQWQSVIDVDHRKNITGHIYYNGNVYLIYSESESSREILLVEINLQAKSFVAHLFKPEANIHFAHFTVIKSKIIFGGYIHHQATLFMYDMQREVARTLPGTFEPNVELLDIRTNVNGTFNVVIKDRLPGGKKKLVVRTFNDEGLLLFEKRISVDDNKTILEAMTNTLEHDEIAVLGTWAYGNNKLAAGVFSLSVDAIQDQPLNYYWLTDLDHFLDYLNPKKAAKIKAKAEWRKTKNKSAQFGVRLSSIRIHETEQGFYFLTEAYEPLPNSNSNSNSNSNYHSPYGFHNTQPYPYAYNPPNSRSVYSYNSSPPYFYNTNTINNPLRVFQSSLSFFDLKGRLQFDRSLKFQEINMNIKEQVSDFIEYKGVLTMGCKNEKDIILEYVKNGSASVEQKFNTQLNDTEIVKSESQDNSGIRAWYDGYFYVFGYHTVQYKADKNSRNVFYINKIKGD